MKTLKTQKWDGGPIYQHANKTAERRLAELDYLIPQFEWDAAIPQRTPFGRRMQRQANARLKELRAEREKLAKNR